MTDFARAPYEDMGPTTLAAQPPTPSDRMQKDEAWWDPCFKYLENRVQSLTNWRYPSWAYWAVLAKFFIPRRYLFLVTANRMWRGNPINDAIIDSTAQMAVRTCRSGLWTGLCSPSRPWFKIGMEYEGLDADEKAWFEDTEQKTYTVLRQSNFYDTMSQGFEDVTVFGNAPIITYEDKEDVCRFYLPCAGEYFLAKGARLAVNTLPREFTLTVSQIVEQFRLENCPQQIQKHWQAGELDIEFVVRHMIEPNFALDARGRSRGNDVQPVPAKFTWREIYWLKGIKTAKPLSRRGFHEQPFTVLQWYTQQNDAYARSPCMDALGDNKQVQQETYRKAEYIEKGVRPPMLADPSLKNEPASVMPAMITYVSTEAGKKGFWPAFEINPAWLQWITADIAQVNKRIEKCLFVELFMAISQMEGVQPRNELELTKRDLERLQELGPVVDLAEKAFDLIILRVIEIMRRRGLLKPMPPKLAKRFGTGIPLKITYISIMRLAQRAAESIAMKDTFQTAGALSSAAKAAGVADPIRRINLDKALMKYGDLNNFPSDLWYSDEEVAHHDAIRAQEMAKAQAPQQAMAGVTAAKTLSDTQLPGGNTALGAILGQNGPAGQ